MAGLLTFWLPAGFVLVAALAMAAGWHLRKRFESQHKRAVEASAQEFVSAAGRARDRARIELEELETRHKLLRVEHSQCTQEITALNEACAELQAGLDRATRQIQGGDFPAVARKRPVSAKRADASVSKPSVRPNRAKKSAPPRAAKEAEPVEAGPVKSPARNSRGSAVSDRKAERRPSDTPAFVLRVPDGPKDDLKAIHGIGPGLEQALNALGIFHYSQLAALSNEDIAWLGQRLGAFPGRIVKDGWTVQARHLFATSPAKSAKRAKRRRSRRPKQADEIRA